MGQIPDMTGDDCVTFQLCDKDGNDLPPLPYPRYWINNGELKKIDPWPIATVKDEHGGWVWLYMDSTNGTVPYVTDDKVRIKNMTKEAIYVKVIVFRNGAEYDFAMEIPAEREIEGWVAPKSFTGHFKFLTHKWVMLLGTMFLLSCLSSCVTCRTQASSALFPEDSHLDK